MIYIHKLNMPLFLLGTCITINTTWFLIHTLIQYQTHNYEKQIELHESSISLYAKLIQSYETHIKYVTRINQQLQKDQLQKDQLQKDQLQKDQLQKDQLQKDQLQKDQLQKDQLQKDQLQKENNELVQPSEAKEVEVVLDEELLDEELLDEGYDDMPLSNVKKITTEREPSRLPSTYLTSLYERLVN